MHQRQRRLDRRVLRRGHDAARRPAPRRAARRTAAGTARSRTARRVSSFGTTINVLEGLLEHERAIGGSAGVAEARRRGEEYMLERRLLRRKSTGEVIDPTWLAVRVPDLVALRRPARARLPTRRRGSRRTSACSEAIEQVAQASARRDGRWLLDSRSTRAQCPLRDGPRSRPARAAGSPSARCACFAGPNSRTHPSSAPKLA